MMPNSYMAILHHQIVYRLQDHALDLPIPGHTKDTLFIKAEEEDEVPTIIQIPKQLPRDKLTEIMPLKWITNYEKAFQNTTHVIASNTKFTKLSDGSIQATYEPISTPAISAFASDASTSAPTIFQVLMIPLSSLKKRSRYTVLKLTDLLSTQTKSMATLYGTLTQRCVMQTVMQSLF
ncbi:hypothetical protein Ddye_022545 [Dipteronia dyeriana]|uniref:Uncharacterized protein n=1 Tax=Dipteronia dyeriana TaxID=168575 RepID=A0AAD9TRR1_9ROSI|nr:hypothetical protein Ddye_022545 [Dipteronia dyeriana]